MDSDLKKHSALTNFKIVTGKKLKLNAYKVIQALYSSEQNILKESYRKNILKYIDLFSEDRETVLNNIYNEKELILTSKLDMEKLPKIVMEIVMFNLEDIELLDKKRYIEKILEIKESISFKLCNAMPELRKNLLTHNKDLVADEQNIVLNNDNKNMLLKEIKKICKKKTISECNKVQKIDYNLLVRSLGINATRLKTELKDAVNTSFEFNFLNYRKEMEIDLKVAMLSSVKFKTGRNGTYLEYEIPSEILKLLLMPKTFAEIKSQITFKFKTEYSFNLYSLLKDCLYMKKVVLTKDEISDFLNLPKKARESKYELQNRILIPAIAEIESFSDLKVTYELVPEIKFREIIFYIEKNDKFKTISKDPIRKVKEPKKQYIDNVRIVKAVEKARRNIYVSRAFNKNFQNKINNMYNEYSEDFVVLILNNLYSSLNKNIETTLVQYVNGMIKNLKDEAKENKKRLSKKMLDTLLNKKIKEIDEDIIPEFNSELEVELFLKNLPQSSLHKIQISKAEEIKLILGLKRVNKSDAFIKGITDKFFEIKEDK